MIYIFWRFLFHWEAMWVNGAGENHTERGLTSDFFVCFCKVQKIPHITTLPRPKRIKNNILMVVYLLMFLSR
jgi:hypothetical protein